MFISKPIQILENIHHSDDAQLYILNAANDIALFFLLEDGKPIIEYYNQNAEQYFFWQGKDQIGKNFLELIENVTLKGYVAECLQDFVLNLDSSLEYYPVCQRDERIIIWSFKQILFDFKKQAGTYFLLIGDDITEEERLRNERQQTQDYLDNIKNCMPGNVYWKDKEGKYIGCNDYLLSQHNLLKPKENIIGKTDYDIFSKEVADELRLNDKEVMESEVPISFEENIQLPNQSVRTYLVNKAPLRNRFGQVIGVVGNSIEITELKETQAALVKAKEEAEEANFTKSLFMENMSHDFKTPLNAIFGVLQILDMTPDLPEDVKKLIQVQEKSMQRLKKMVDSILDFSKVYSGKIEIQHEEVNLLEVVENIVHNLSYLVKDKNVNIIINYPPEVPRHLLSDSNAVTSILLNLMSNAVKFTDNGYVAITVKSTPVKSKKSTFEISIEDTGSGIPENKLHQIFERFHRLELSNKGKKAGHGIGLSVVKELIEKLNGQISVKSQVDKGSIFSVVFPFEIDNENVDVVSEWEKEYSGIRVLIVNDKYTATNIISEQLTTADIHKTDSMSALNKLLSSEASNPYQIVIIDDEIQSYNPNDLAMEINNQTQLSAKMILSSCHPQNKEGYDAARAAGYFGFIIKPILPSELSKKMIVTWKKWQKNKFLL